MTCLRYQMYIQSFLRASAWFRSTGTMLAPSAGWFFGSLAPVTSQIVGNMSVNSTRSSTTRPGFWMPAGQLTISGTRVPVSLMVPLPPTTFVPFHGVTIGVSVPLSPVKMISVLSRTPDFSSCATICPTALSA